MVGGVHVRNPVVRVPVDEQVRVQRVEHVEVDATDEGLRQDARQVRIGWADDAQVLVDRIGAQHLDEHRGPPGRPEHDIVIQLVEILAPVVERAARQPIPHVHRFALAWSQPPEASPTQWNVILTVTPS